ncbi:hypothetical protein, conserved [Trypanosoma brucei gambiense DAL972]|uniref:Uncharacterized protein n=1 Tax=Trypanosoma brucei gambiense (strain MHOM/CI/86/DAL972) TaxID=679716 RepID=C9ZQZ3_TRYB9|nr:hypothetical protein, conserved [Trypanosoma brucei gambiense DAL972]CBH11823.1 hypothetical protein, conserved [Trypanosoma brucei gambiense DAL972]|eukprot:XP_011774108.1 hypothetical protein, conserved [Trypanosoma brucei gambiense DAL972]
MPVRQKYPPVGCNMNDTGYPFRGDYKLQPALNHGHAGAIRKENTTLMLRITGSNLAIEKLQPSKGQKLQCELSIDDGIPKSINFPSGCGVVPVPADGHEYNLTAIVHGAGVKHYCKMSLNGTEGKGIFRLRAPSDSFAAENIRLCADGDVIYPSGGWYAIPIQAKECSLEFVGRQASRLVSTQPLFHAVAESSTVMIQCTAGTTDNAVIYCSGSGESINVVQDRPVRLSLASGPFTLLLPRTTPGAAQVRPSHVPNTPLQPPPSDSSVHRVPEVETSTIDSPEGPNTPPIFVTTADGFMIELTGDNGTSAAGYGRVQLPLPDRMTHRVQIKVSDMTGRIYLRQTAVVPSTQPPPLTFSITKDAAGGHMVKGSTLSQISIDNQPVVSGAVGASITDNARHVVTVREGSASAVFEVVAQPSAAAGPVAVRQEPQPAVPSGGTLLNSETWVNELAKALQCTDINDCRQGVQNIIPRSPEATVILGFVSQNLFKVAPTISFSREGDSVSDIQCPGHTITASINNGAPCTLSGVASIQVPSGHKVTLSALSPSTGRVVASCCAHYPPATQKNLDEHLVARLLELFQRCSLNPEAVLAELQNITQPQSAVGQQLVSYLIGCFRRLLECFQRPINLFAGDTLPNVQLLAYVDDQIPKELTVASPVTVSCANTNVRVSAREPPAAALATRGGVIHKLVEAYRENAPTELMAQLMVISPTDPDERALVDLLSRVLKDYEAKLKRERDNVISSTAADYLQFSCDGVTMENIRTSNPCQLSFEVDGTGFVALEQGGQIPQGYSFPAGSTHCVHVIARDTASGALRAEAYITLKGTKCGPSTMSAPQNEALFLDASVMVVMEEIHLRLLCPPTLSLKCEVDGGGDVVGTKSSEFMARMNASSMHNVNVHLIDEVGNVVFRQRLAVPPIAMVQWALRLDSNSLYVDSTTASCTSFLTSSLNRCPEKELNGPLQLDCSGPQTVVLRKYTLGAVQGRTCVGEMYMMIPPFVDATHLKDLAQIYREASQLQSDELQRRLNEVRAQVPMGLMKDLITVLMENTAGAFNASIRSVGPDRGPRVHFRISGDETKLLSD